MIDNIIKYIVDSNITPSINYGIIHNKNTTFSYGYKELIPNKELTDINTLYDLASLTKVIVTNTLFYLLKEKNMINENDLVIKYLPDFIHKDITINHLLTHSSGLKNNINYTINNTRELYIKALMNVESTFELGYAYYCDLNYILLGLIIESLLNKPLDIIAKELIFDKLGMNNTTYSPKDNYASYEVVNNITVKGYVHDNKARILGPCGHAGLFSNINDLLIFTQMILNNGTYNNTKFLSKESIDDWFKIKTFDHNHILFQSNSWLVGKSELCDLSSNNTISHTGFTGTSLVIDRDNNLAVILLSNRIHPSRNNKRYNVYRRIINNLIYKNIDKY